MSNNNAGHIVRCSTLVIGHTKYPGAMRISSWPFVPKKLQDTNRQDMVFTHPPAEDGKQLVLQASAPVQNPYTD
jgi:hypothetical protein